MRSQEISLEAFITIMWIMATNKYANSTMSPLRWRMRTSWLGGELPLAIMKMSHDIFFSLSEQSLFRDLTIRKGTYLSWIPSLVQISSNFVKIVIERANSLIMKVQSVMTDWSSLTFSVKSLSTKTNSSMLKRDE